MKSGFAAFAGGLCVRPGCRGFGGRAGGRLEVHLRVDPVLVLPRRSPPGARAAASSGAARALIRTSGRVTSIARLRSTPAGWISACLRRPSASRTAANASPRASTRKPRPAAVGEERSSEAEVDEGGDALGAERVDHDERGRQARCLRDDREPLETDEHAGEQRRAARTGRRSRSRSRARPTS